MLLVHISLVQVVEEISVNALNWMMLAWQKEFYILRLVRHTAPQVLLPEQIRHFDDTLSVQMSELFFTVNLALEHLNQYCYVVRHNILEGNL